MKSRLNEQNIINNLLKAGPLESSSEDFNINIRLLIRYYYNQGLKPKMVKDKIIAEHWANYNGVVDYKALNKMLQSERSTYYKFNKKGKAIPISNLNTITVNKKAFEWIDKQDLTLNSKKILKVYYVYCKVQEKTRSANKAKLSDWTQATRNKIKKSIGITSRDLIPFYRELNDKGFIFTPIFTFGVNFSEANKKCAEIYLSGNKLKTYLDADTYKGLNRQDGLVLLVQSIDEKRPAVCSFMDLIDESGDDIEVEADYISGNLKEWLMLNNNKNAVKCSVCGKVIEVRSHNKKQNCMCADCKREKERLRAKKNRELKKAIKNTNSNSGMMEITLNGDTESKFAPYVIYKEPEEC